MITKNDVGKVLLCIAFCAGMFFLIDWRLKQVEAERCRIWKWEVCVQDECVEVEGEL